MAAFGFGIYMLFPDGVGGPPLPVTVTIDRQPVETTSGRGMALTEVVVIENPNDHPIPRLTVDINDQYLYLQNSPLAAGETLVLPQRVFTDKRSSARFEPSRYDVEEIVVTGQLPSGARGVSKFYFADHLQP